MKKFTAIFKNSNQFNRKKNCLYLTKPVKIPAKIQRIVGYIDDYGMVA